MSIPNGLFEPDMFSDPRPRWSAVAPEVAGTVKALAARHYHHVLGPLTTVEQSGGIEVNSNNYRVGDEHLRLILKRAASSDDRALGERHIRIAAWLSANGEPVAAPVAAQDGDWVVNWGGGSWSAWEFVDGDYFSGAQAMLDSAAGAVATTHRSLAKLPKELWPMARIDLSIEKLATLGEEMAARRDDWTQMFGQSDAARLNQSWPAVEDALALLRDHRADIAETGPTACHYDLHPHNLLMTGNRVRAVLDLDSIVRGLLPAAVGFATFKLMRQHAVADGLSDQPGEIQTRAARFLETACDTASLAGLCHRTVGLFARSEIVRRLAVIFELNLTRRDRSWNRVLGIQLRALDEIDIVFGRA